MSTDAPLPDAPPAAAALPDDPATLKGMIRELLEQLRNEQHARQAIEQRLDQLLRRLYGPKGEHFRPDQPALFDPPSELPVAPAPEPPAIAVGSAPCAGAKRGHGRRRLPADLRRERVVHDLSEAEKTCPCCQAPRVLLGEETSEQLDYRPATLFVREHVRLKYACPKCLKASTSNDELNDGSTTTSSPLISDSPSAHIVTAPKPPQPIDKGLPGPGLLAHVVVSKYVDHLPLHRQEMILARQGVPLARSTLCDWMAAAATVLTPLYTLMLSDVLESQVIQTDETRVPVLDPGTRKTKSGRLWVFVGDRDHPHTVYDYTPTKARDGPAAILKNYAGYLQADAANVFDGLYKPGAIVEVGCWAHARRYFHEARDSDPARAAEALTRIRGIYEVEHEANEVIARDGLIGAAADDCRRRLRQEKTRPRLAAFADWLEAQAPLVLPKSPLGQAVAYARRQWAALQRFTEHGFLNIDNNASERALRAVAVGRKNWLFAGSDTGGRTAAVLYTLTQSCRRHGIDPFGMRPAKSLLSCRGSLEVSLMETSTCLGDNGIRSGSSTGDGTSTGNRPAA